MSEMSFKRCFVSRGNGNSINWILNMHFQSEKTVTILQKCKLKKSLKDFCFSCFLFTLILFTRIHACLNFLKYHQFLPRILVIVKSNLAGRSFDWLYVSRERKSGKISKLQPFYFYLANAKKLLKSAQNSLSRLCYHPLTLTSSLCLPLSLWLGKFCGFGTAEGQR